MEKKFTEGEWYFEDGKVRHNPNPYTRSSVWKDEDLQLMATSKHLLEALENLTILAEGYHIRLFGGNALRLIIESKPIDVHPILAAKAAIKKAYGEQ